MSHYLLLQPNCAAAWLQAVKFVDGQVRHEAYNVLFDIANPTQGADFDDPIVSLVEEFLSTFNKSVFSIANTIFPNGLYRRYGAPYFIEEFHQRVLPKVRRTDRWSGYYFERMTAYSNAEGKSFNQLWSIVERIRDPQNKSLNKFEVSLFDPWKDIDSSPYGGQCLSFLSFKLLPGKEKNLALTAMYRNHFYIEKLLGNLIGLGWLMAFVANECGVGIGPLTVLSTHAKVDQPGKTKRDQIDELLQRCSGAWT